MFIDLRNPPSALSRDFAELFLGRADSCRALRGVQLQTSPEGAGNQDFRFHYSRHTALKRMAYSGSCVLSKIEKAL